MFISHYILVILKPYNLKQFILNEKTFQFFFQQYFKAVS